MLTRRLIYLITLISVISFYAYYPRWFSWYLLVLVLLLIPLDFILSIPGMLTRKLMFIAPRIMEKDAKGEIMVATVQNKPYPARSIKIIAYAEKRKSAIEDELSAFVRTKKDKSRYTIGAQHDARCEINIDTSQIGVVSYSVKRKWAVSLLGLLSLPSPVNYETSILILPPPLKPPETLALPRGMVFHPKRGGGFAENHDLRPYLPGDPIKNIHWKVSAKYDSIIIREPLVPPPHSRLVSVAEWRTTKHRDIILGRLRWVADQLLKLEMPFYIRIGENGHAEEVQNHDDLENFLYRELCNLTTETRLNTGDPTQFAWIIKVDAAGG